VFSINQLQSIHVEISNRCQAKCPMCSRNHHGGIKNPLLKESDWTIQQFKNIFTPVIKQQIKKITFCGNFGDPLLNFHFVKMLDYIKD
jgi:MoaA/NifB/PqqE/SkfB family radical SAM enzyme